MERAKCSSDSSSKWGNNSDKVNKWASVTELWSHRTHRVIKNEPHTPDVCAQ